MPYKDKNSPEAIASRKRCQERYYKNHTELCRERSRKSMKKLYDSDPERILKRNRKWREENPNKVRQNSLDWAKAHPEKIREICREATTRWRERNPDYSKEKNKKLRLKVLMHYSNGSLKCNECGEAYIEFLTIDHIEGNGNKHRRKIGSKIYRWLVKNNFPEGYQVLCWNCNFVKGDSKPTELLSLRQKYRKNYYKKIRFEMLKHYSNGIPKCVCCGDDNQSHLAIDHINGGGYKQGKKYGHKCGFNFYLWLRKQGYPEGYRVLCHNCNSSLGIYGYCPHKKCKA